MEATPEQTRAVIVAAAKKAAKPTKLLHVTAQDLLHAFGEDVPTAAAPAPPSPGTRGGGPAAPSGDDDDE